MNLFYPLLPEPISLDEGAIHVLILENPQELRKAIFTLREQLAGQSGEFILSEQFKPIELSKYAAFLSDPSNLNFESKKLTGKIQHVVCEVGENFAQDFQKLAVDINALASKMSVGMDFAVSFHPLESIEQLVDLLKFYIDKEELSFPEQILLYMKLYRSFLGVRLFVFYNLKACLSLEECSLLYKSIFYEKFSVLLLEDTQRGTALPEEKTVIIDADLCAL